MFEPWCGDQWGQADNAVGGVRLLVLGESHHCGEREVGAQNPQMTINVIRAYLDGTLDRHSKRFFTKIARLVARQPGREASVEDTRRVWRSCLFYNYVPRVAANGPRQAPPDHLWQVEAPEAFAGVIKQWKVEAVLVCGDRLWWRMPAGLGGAPTFQFEGQQRFARTYENDETAPAVAAHMHHPSAPCGWAVTRWRPVVDFLFDEVTRRRATGGSA